MSERDNWNRSEMIRVMESLAPERGSREVMPGLRFARATSPSDKVCGVYKPSLCVVARGRKEILVGDQTYEYNSENYLVATVEMPMTGRVIEASRAKPYLSLRFEIEPALVGSTMLEASLSPTKAAPKAVYVSRLGSDLLDALVRLICLAERPESASVLMPLTKREIVYRLLTDEQGARLLHLPSAGAHSHRIAQAVERLRKGDHQSLRIDTLADELGMSPSGFHHHFKAVMDMSPLQFQKLIRLQEARQLMVGENLDAATAGYRVGYEDPAHFSRDYKRQFGAPPMRDIAKLRESAPID